MEQVQQVPCSACEGYKRVAIITHGPRMFAPLLNKPMAVTYAKAKSLLEGFKGQTLQHVLIKSLLPHLDTAPCPHCNATGTAFTLTFGEPNTSFEKVS